MKMKRAVCVSDVPSCLNNTETIITKGSVVEYEKVVFRNGEHHIQLTNNQQLPAVFFNV